VVSMEVPLTWGEHRPIVDSILNSSGRIIVLSTDFTTAGAGINFGLFYNYGLAFGAGGMDWSAAELALRMRHQRELIREHVGKLAWAGVTIDPEDIFFLTPRQRRYDAAEPSPMWYQVLSPAQLRRLGGAPSGSVELEHGRIELTVGEPEQWTPGHPDRDAVFNHARTLLTPA
jgi:hypothetical protein